MNDLKKNAFLNAINPFNKNSMTPTLLIVFAFMIMIFSIINPLFVSLANIKSILANLTISGVMAVGLTTVVLTGNFDISVGSTLGVAAIVCAKLYNIGDTYIPLPIVIIAGIAAGAAIGAINGFLVSVVGINSIISTLGTLAVFRGLAYLYGTETAQIYYKPYVIMGRGYVFKHIPLTMIYFIVILVIMYLILRFTRFGRDIYQIGANSQAARLAGVSIKKTTFLTFVISGITAGIGGILLSSQLAFAQGEFGLGYEFKILTICVLAGISLAGGRGTLVGVLVATLILGSIANGLSLSKVPIEWRDAFEGLILIIAIMVDSIRVRRRMLLRA
jgi:ribose transport system permease protein